MNKKDPFDIKLDPYEQEIEDALPNRLEELPVTPQLEKELARSKEAAAYYLRKNAKTNKTPFQAV